MTDNLTSLIRRDGSGLIRDEENPDAWISLTRCSTRGLTQWSVVRHTSHPGFPRSTHSPFTSILSTLVMRECPSCPLHRVSLPSHGTLKNDTSSAPSCSGVPLAAVASSAPRSRLHGWGALIERTRATTLERGFESHPGECAGDEGHDRSTGGPFERRRCSP